MVGWLLNHWLVARLALGGPFKTIFSQAQFQWARHKARVPSLIWNWAFGDTQFHFSRARLFTPFNLGLAPFGGPFNIPRGPGTNFFGPRERGLSLRAQGTELGATL